MEMNNENLRKLIEAVANEEYSIDDAIQDAKDMEDLLEDSFSKSFSTCTTLKRNLLLTLMEFKLAKLKLRLARFKLALFNSDTVEVFDNIINKTDDIIYKLTEDLSLVDKSRKALNKLYKYRTISCNYDIYMLHALIDTRRRILVDEYNDYVDVTGTRMDGIYYISNKNFEKQDQEYAKIIEDSAIKLGLLK